MVTAITYVTNISTFRSYFLLIWKYLVYWFVKYSLSMLMDMIYMYVYILIIDDIRYLFIVTKHLGNFWEIINILIALSSCLNNYDSARRILIITKTIPLIQRSISICCDLLYFCSMLYFNLYFYFSFQCVLYWYIYLLILLIFYSNGASPITNRSFSKIDNCKKIPF